GGGVAKLAEGTTLTPMDAAIVAYAGLEAGRMRLQARGTDGGYVRELDGAGSDLERVHRELPGDDEAARQARGEAQDRAWEILRRRWSDMERLADRLHASRFLDADEVADVLGVAPPPPRRPAAADPARSRSGAGRRAAMTCIREHIGADGRRRLEGGYIVADHPEVLANPDCYGPWPGRAS
ncbi:MAG TPA: hypothetical protein VFG74_02255, partial [Miltoncostaeaceae bacterium]|nr:hypothetical protein [Miltoncostaeaceae bacterium]